MDCLFQIVSSEMLHHVFLFFKGDFHLLYDDDDNDGDVEENNDLIKYGFPTTGHQETELFI